MTAYFFVRVTKCSGEPDITLHSSLPGDHRDAEPPDSIPNSAVKCFIADGSVGFPHVRVGHRQVSSLKAAILYAAFF